MTVKSLFLSLLLLFTLSGNALPCTCYSETTQQALKKATAIFTGQVISINFVEDNYYQIKIKLERSYKGSRQSIVTIYSEQPSPGNCGFRFKIGEQYLIYSYLIKHDKRLFTSVCTRTKELASAGDDLNQLGSGRPPKP